MPAVFTTRVGNVRLSSMALDRVAFRLRAGRAEPLPREHVAQHDTLDAHGASVLGAMELGRAASAQNPRGLSIDGAPLLPFSAREGSARLVVSASGVQITTQVPTEGDAIEGTLLIAHAQARALTDSVVSGTRAAVGLTHDQRLLWAEGEDTPEALQRLLLAAGAETALLLWPSPETPRGHWGDDVLDAYGSSSLFVLAQAPSAPVARLEALLTAARPTASPAADAGR
jgi:hypothetical protein